MADYGQITVFQDGAEIRSFPLAAEGAVRLGRLPDNEIQLEASDVSRHHAELRVQATGVVLTDTGSSNGTFLAGSRLAADQPVPLEDGATWTVGPFTLVYRAAGAEDPSTDTLAEAPAEPAPPPAPPPPPPAPKKRAAPPPPELPRASLPAPLPDGEASRYLQFLPPPYQEGDFMGRYLHLFEAIWEPMEQRQDHIEAYFDPRTCPEGFLGWLAGWIGLSLERHWPEPRRRRLLAEAMDLYRWRGTRYGLVRIIEVCTGLTPEITEDPSAPFVFRVRVRAPKGAAVDRDLIEDLVRSHKPAHTGYSLEIG